MTAAPTAIAPGQLWKSRVAPHIYSPRRVTAVHGALVDTDHGRTTVFALRRNYQLAEEVTT